METRKIQNTASGSFFITLPKQWMRELDINKGEDLLIARDENGSIILTPLKDHGKYQIEFVIQIEDYSEENSLARCINSSYVQGSDIIQILSNETISLEKKRIIKLTVSNLIGTEISEEFAKTITIRTMVDPVKFPLGELIKRIYLLVHSMHVDAIKSFQNHDEILANDVIAREAEVEKFYFLMLRQLNLSLLGRLDLSEICDSELKIDCVLGILLARDLSKMAHYARHIAEQSLKLADKNIDSALITHLTSMSRFVIKMQQNAIQSFFFNDFMRANQVLNNSLEIQKFDLKTEREVLEKINDTGTIISLISISRNLRNLASSAVAVSQDLQAKHRPKTTHKVAEEPKTDFSSLDIFTKGLDYEAKK